MFALKLGNQIEIRFISTLNKKYINKTLNQPIEAEQLDI